jgi:thiamine pyrophosphokinase
VTSVANATRAIVLADGAVPARELLDTTWPGWDAGTGYVVAADGGARHAPGLGLVIDRWVGDGDSIEPGELERLAAAGVEIDRVPAEKNESDTELAVNAAIAWDATDLVILGALGGPRLDHALMNVALLMHPVVADCRTCLFDERGTRISILQDRGRAGRASGRFEGRTGDIVSLLPLGRPAVGVTTQGLRYPLEEATLEVGRSRGLSNVRTEPAARISLLSGRLLVIETPVTVER